MRLGRVVVRQVIPKLLAVLPVTTFNPAIHSLNIVRHTSTFFTQLTADEIWGGVSAVSKAGKKRGRGKRGDVRKKVDLNKGQTVGLGASNMVWPGLNHQIFDQQSSTLNQRHQLPVNPNRGEELVALREKFQPKMKRKKLTPLERGWTGDRLPGKSVGPPDSVADYKFEGFDTRVLEYKRVATMTGVIGRKVRYSCFVVTGNGKGLAGYGLAKAPFGIDAVRKAKNRAAQKLQYFELCDGHTVWHNFHKKELKTSLFVEKKQKEYGLRCHRVIKTICEIIGIKDLYAKVEGSTKNTQKLTKAFFDGLGEMETHQQLADRVNLNVVETREETDNFPFVVARPEKCLQTVNPEEDLNFERLYYNGKVPYVRPVRPPFYAEYYSHKKRCNEKLPYRNQSRVMITRAALDLNQRPDEW